KTPARKCRPHQAAPSIACSTDDFELLRNFLHQAASTDRNWRPLPGALFSRPPDSAITARIAARGSWNIRAIIKHFRMVKETGKKPDHSYGWFEHMITATWPVAAKGYPPSEPRTARPVIAVCSPSEPLNPDLPWDRARALLRARLG